MVWPSSFRRGYCHKVLVPRLAADVVNWYALM
jgi:hypothetical protein